MQDNETTRIDIETGSAQAPTAANPRTGHNSENVHSAGTAGVGAASGMGSQMPYAVSPRPVGPSHPGPSYSAPQHPGHTVEDKSGKTLSIPLLMAGSITTGLAIWVLFGSPTPDSTTRVFIGLGAALIVGLLFVFKIGRGRQ